MNPNLRIFFKRTAYVLAFAAVIAAVFYGVTNFTSIDLAAIGSYLMYGFFGIVIAGMFVLVIGMFLRELWTGIMNRADRIVMCCPDKNYNGIHVVASHYSSGGESGEGFSSYFHYYVDDTGRLYLSKKVDDNGNEIHKSVQHLSEQTRLQLEPDLQQSIRVGSNTDEDNPTIASVPIKKGVMLFHGYDGIMDYGFKLTYKEHDRKKWTVRI